MNKVAAYLIGSLVLLGLLFWQLGRIAPARPNGAGSPQTETDPAKPPLVVYVAASNRPVFEEFSKDFERRFKIPVEAQYGASQTLLTSLDVSKTGDLYLPADSSYLDRAREKDLVREIYPLGKMTAALAVAKGNPKGIKTLDDVLKEGVRFVQANPDAAAIGLLTRNAFTKTGQWEKLESRTATFKTTVNDVANDIKAGAADAGIVYDVVIQANPELEQVVVPELFDIKALVQIAILNSTAQPAEAVQLAKDMADPTHGQLLYRKYGFERP
jgi:molybdate transport system substrate-binding protein